jgi:hypothetical protein
MSDEYGRRVCSLAVTARTDGWTGRKLVTTSPSDTHVRSDWKPN